MSKCKHCSTSVNDSRSQPVSSSSLVKTKHLIQLHKIKKKIWQNPASQKMTGKNIWVRFAVKKLVILVYKELKKINKVKEQKFLGKQANHMNRAFTEMDK